MALKTGDTIQGYYLLRKLGAGNFGSVYKALHANIDHPVVIKVLHPQHLDNAEAVERFAIEADTIVRLRHPNVVPLYDYWKDEEGAYLVLKWMPGGTLRENIDAGELPTMAGIADLLERIGSALVAAHKQNIIHRDIKPANILFDVNGNAYLSDFGIAKHPDVNLTASRAVLGTPAYLAPEYILNRSATPQSDIYSLGILTYELLTGDRPYHAKNAMKLLAHHLKTPMPVYRHENPVIQRNVNLVLNKATAKRPANRYKSGLSFATDFRKAIQAAQPLPDVL